MKKASERRSRILIGIVSDVTSNVGRGLAEVASRLDGVKIGKCKIVEADVDAVTLIDWAHEVGATRISLIFPLKGGCAEKKGVIEKGIFVPKRECDEVDAGEIIQEIWMNLSGSLGEEDYYRALKKLSDIPFIINEICSEMGEVEKIVREWIEKVCES